MDERRHSHTEEAVVRGTILSDIKNIYKSIEKIPDSLFKLGSEFRELKSKCDSICSRLEKCESQILSNKDESTSKCLAITTQKTAEIDKLKIELSLIRNDFSHLKKSIDDRTNNIHDKTWGVSKIILTVILTFLSLVALHYITAESKIKMPKVYKLEDKGK